MKNFVLPLLFFAFLSVGNGMQGQSVQEVKDTLEEAYPVKETISYPIEGTILGASINNLGPRYFSQFSLEAFSVYKNGFGTFGLVEYSKSFTYPQWAKNGYNLKDCYYLTANAAVSYDFKGGNLSRKILIGASLNQISFGPFLGLYLDYGRWSFKATGVYSVASPFKSNHSQDSTDIYGNRLVHIKGIDPNSWYKASIVYAVTDNLKIGAVSERFYSNCGLSGEYEFKTKGDRIVSGIKLRVVAGRNLEINQNCFQFGILIKTK